MPHPGASTEAAGCADLLCLVVGVPSAAPACDVGLALVHLAVSRCSLCHVFTLVRLRLSFLRGYVDDVVAADDGHRHGPLDLAVVDLLCVLEDEVHVRVEALEDAAVLPAGLELHDDPVVQALVEHVQGPHRPLALRPLTSSVIRHPDHVLPSGLSQLMI